MKKITAFIFTLLLPLLAFCQQDSIVFSQQNWKTKNISKGVIWKTTTFSSIFNTSQIINILEIDLKKHNKNLGIQALAQSRELTSTLAKQSQALLAINAGFFDMQNGGGVDLVKVKGETINHSLSKNLRANAYVAFNKKSILISSDSTQIALYENIIESGPLLIENNQLSILQENPFNNTPHPRTAIGIKQNKLILITVDGRRKESQGLNLNQLQHIMKWYGCLSAMNLDGGGSTTMYIQGEGENGIVNYPSDNKKLDHFGERKVSNIIYLKNR